MFKKILKFEIKEMKAALLSAAFVLALIAIVLFLGIRNYSNTMASFKECFQDKELSLLDFYNEEDSYLFKPEQFRFRTCLIPAPYAHFLNGNYPAIYANVGIDPLVTYSERRYSDMTGEGLGLNTILFYFCLFVFVYGLFVNSSIAGISKLVGLKEKNVKIKLFLSLFAIRVSIITIFLLMIVAVYVIIGAFFEIKIFGTLLIAYSILAVLAAILSFSIGVMLSFAKSFLEIVLPGCLLIIILFFPFFNTDNIGDNDIDRIVKKEIEEFDANILYAVTSLPAGFSTGIFTIIFYILIIVFIGYRYFLKNWHVRDELRKK